MGPKIIGNNPPTAIIDAQKQGKVFIINFTVNVTLKNLLIQNGTAIKDTTNPFGGGIYNNGTLNIQNCTIQENTAKYGGEIYNNKKCILNLTDTNANQNTANNDGGEIYNYK
jgi:hypothetical protein